MVSTYFNTPPANELDERIAAGLLLLTAITPDIKTRGRVSNIGPPTIPSKFGRLTNRQVHPLWCLHRVFHRSTVPQRLQMQPTVREFQFLIAIADAGKVPKCLSVNDMNSILRINLGLNFVTLAIPTIVLWKVQTSWRKKARLFALMFIGLIACIASVITLVSQFTLAKTPRWNFTTLLAWSKCPDYVCSCRTWKPTKVF